MASGERTVRELAAEVEKAVDAYTAAEKDHDEARSAESGALNRRNNARKALEAANAALAERLKAMLR